MAIPASGPLTMTTIQTEFGGSNPISLSEYYAGGGLVPAGTTGTYGAVPSSGTISIQKFYGTSNYTGYWAAEFSGVSVAPNGNWVDATGIYLNDNDSGGFIRISPNDTIAYGGTLGISGVGSSTRTFKAVTVDGSGNVYMTGSWDNGVNNRGNFVGKYDSNLSPLWGFVEVGQSGGSDCYKNVFDSSGNLVTCPRASIGTPASTPFLLRISPSGTVVSQTVAKDSTNIETSTAVAKDSSGNLYMIADTLNGSTYRAGVAKFSSTGATQIWNTSLEVSGSNLSTTGLVIDSADNVYVAASPRVGSGSVNAFVRKTNSAGTLIWELKFTFSLPFQDIADISIDASDNIYLSSTTYISSVFTTVVWKFNSSGVFQWGRQLTYAPGGTPASKFAKLYVYGSKLHFTGYNSLVVLPTDGSRTGTYGSWIWATYAAPTTGTFTITPYSATASGTPQFISSTALTMTSTAASVTQTVTAI